MAGPLFPPGRLVATPGALALLRGCYELAQEWLANVENGGSKVNRSNRGIRIPMRFFNQVHNTL